MQVKFFNYFQKLKSNLFVAHIVLNQNLQCVNRFLVKYCFTLNPCVLIKKHLTQKNVYVPTCKKHTFSIRHENSLSVFMADAKSTLSYSSNIHFSVFQNRPDRGALICWKICLKKFKNKKKGWKWCMPNKKGQHWCCMPDKCNIFENESTSISDWYCHHRYDNYSKITIKYMFGQILFQE